MLVDVVLEKFVRLVALFLEVADHLPPVLVGAEVEDLGDQVRRDEVGVEELAVGAVEDPLALPHEVVVLLGVVVPRLLPLRFLLLVLVAVGAASAAAEAIVAGAPERVAPGESAGGAVVAAAAGEVAGRGGGGEGRRVVRCGAVAVAVVVILVVVRAVLLVLV